MLSKAIIWQEQPYISPAAWEKADLMDVKYRLAADGMWEAINTVHGGLFPGIYRLHVLDEYGEFLPLPRLLDMEPDGIVYIGTSVAVPNRVGSLKKSVAAAYWQVDAQTYARLPYRDAEAHQAGKKIVRIPRFVQRFPFERLCVTVERYTSEQEVLDVVAYGHTELEARLLLKYEAQYGEKPALNA